MKVQDTIPIRAIHLSKIVIVVVIVLMFLVMVILMVMVIVMVVVLLMMMVMIIVDEIFLCSYFPRYMCSIITVE